MSTLPLHRRIQEDISATIRNGVWKPGERIPYEHELMAQYGCARMTVSKAMAAVVAAGLVVRRRRAGSFVASPPVQSAVLNIPDLRAEIIERGAVYDYELIARQMKRNDGAADLAGAMLLTLKCRHLADGRPFAFEERKISLVAVPEAARVDFADEPPGTWLLAEVRWTRAEHRIGAVNASKPVAHALAIEPGEACVVVERQTWRGEEGVSWVRQVFPGALYTLVAHFGP
jgi:GntR family transcriptional regulator, histidine utilization repressor